MDVDIQVATMVADATDVAAYIAAGRDLELADEDGATPLFHAAFWAHENIATLLLDAGANVNHQRTDGYTALMVACRNNQPKLVRLFIASGADLGLTEETGDTALHWAYRSKANKCIEALLAAGADPAARNAHGLVPCEVEGTGVDRPDADLDVADSGGGIGAGVGGGNDGNGRNAGGGADSDDSDDAKSAGDDSTVVCKNDVQESSSRGETGIGRQQTFRFSARSSASAPGVDGVGLCFAAAYTPLGRPGTRQTIRLYLYDTRVAARAVKADYEARRSQPPASAAATAATASAAAAATRVGAADDGADDDRVLPIGTQILVQPRFPVACRASPSRAWVSWSRGVHTLEIELRLPADSGGGMDMVGGSLDVFVGLVLVAEVPVEFTVGAEQVAPATPRVAAGDEGAGGGRGSVHGRDPAISAVAAALAAAARSDLVLGPIVRPFPAVFVCHAEADTYLVRAGIEPLRPLGLPTKLFTSGEYDGFRSGGGFGGGGDGGDGDGLPAGSIFQLCWTKGAEACSRIRQELAAAATPARAGGLGIRGVCWEADIAAATVRATDNGPLVALRFHDSWLLSVPNLGARFGALGAGGGAATPEAEVLRASGVSSRSIQPSPQPRQATWAEMLAALRAAVSDASVVDCPRLPWLIPAGTRPRRGRWLKEAVRLSFLCPAALTCARAGPDGDGYRILLPRGWEKSVGSALLVSLLILARAAAVGAIPAGLPLPTRPDTSGDGGASTTVPSATTASPTAALLAAPAATTGADHRAAIAWVLEDVTAALSAEQIAAVDAVLSGAATVPTASTAATAEPAEIVSRSYRHLQMLLEQYDATMDHVGLRRVVGGGGGGGSAEPDDASAVTEWVSAGAAAEFAARGAACLAPVGFETDVLGMLHSLLATVSGMEARLEQQANPAIARAQPAG